MSFSSKTLHYWYNLTFMPLLLNADSKSPPSSVDGELNPFLSDITLTLIDEIKFSSSLVGVVTDPMGLKIFVFWQIEALNASLTSTSNTSLDSCLIVKYAGSPSVLGDISGGGASTFGVTSRSESDVPEPNDVGSTFGVIKGSWWSTFEGNKSSVGRRGALSIGSSSRSSVERTRPTWNWKGLKMS